MASANLQQVIRHIRHLAGGDDSEISDAHLLECFSKSQDEAAFAMLVQRHGPMVLGVCQRILHNSHDAEDAFQATFLLLAQKANTLSKPQALGCWLHEVALRISLRARSQAATRRKHEGQAFTMKQQDWIETVAWRDLQSVLDEEVQRLPKKFRIPFVLCYLEGKTYEQAAGQLGCRTGTISRRLAKARELLQKRLTRRGLTLPAGILAAALSHAALGPSVSASLMHSTMNTVMGGLANAGATAAVSTKIATLAQEGVRNMTISATKATLAIVFLAGLIGSGLLISHHVLAKNSTGKPNENPQQAQTPIQPPAREVIQVAQREEPKIEQRRPQVVKPAQKAAKATQKREMMTIAGTVFDHQFKPADNAWVACLSQPKAINMLDNHLTPLVVIGQVKADKQGKFSLTVPKTSSKTHWNVFLLAWAPGHAPGRKNLNTDGRDAKVTINMGKEKTLRGRLVDLQGQPVAGVPVHVIGLAGGTSFLPGIFRQGYPELDFHQPLHGLKAWPKPVVTDKDGRFTLRGIGNGWMAKIQTGNDRFARQNLIIHPNADMKRRIQQGQQQGRPYAAAQIDEKNPKIQFIWALRPAQVFEGTVTCGDTKKPVPHARIIVYSGKKYFSLIDEDKSEWQADKKGHFRITPLYGKSFFFLAYPPEGSPYLMQQKRFEWKKSDILKEKLDISLPRAIMVEGKITDSATGKPIVGASVEYFPHKKDNPFFKRGTIPHYSQQKQLGVTDKEGRYRLPVLPGKGFLLIMAPGQEYVRTEISPLVLATGRFEMHMHRPHGLVKLDLKAKRKSFTANVTLKRGATLKAKLVDEAGKPVSTAHAFCRAYVPFGYSLENFQPILVTGGEFSLSGLDPNREHTIYVVNSLRQIGATVKLSGKEIAKGPVTIKLHSCGSAKVRFVDEQGKPLPPGHKPGAMLIITPGASRLSFDPAKVWADAAMMRNIDMLRYNLLRVGKDGFFTLPTLVPGATFELYRTTPEGALMNVGKTFTVRAGKTVNLGDVWVKLNQQ